MNAQSPERGQEINADFKKNAGKNPDSKEALDKDLIKLDDILKSEDDGQVIKSSDPESQEWHAREDINADKNRE